MKNSKTKRISGVLLITFVMTFVMSMLAMPASAAESADYYLTNDELYLQYMPKSYDVEKVVMSVDDQKIKFSSPQDLFVDEHDNVYVADTNNNRIIKLDANFNFVKQYPDPNDAKAALNNPTGLYVDGEGDIYVADNGNERIVHLSPEGKFVEEFRQPTEDTYDSEYPFKPTKVYVDEYGIIYAINANDYHGIITLDAKGAFLGYVGTVKTGFDLVQSIMRFIYGESADELLGQNEPPYYLNMTINGDGTIYATSAKEKTNQIKRLTPAGDNVYEEGQFGEENTKIEFNYLPELVDLAVNKDGMVFTADTVTGKIYIYDQNGNSVACFGGEGTKEATFKAISSIAINSKNQILVLDQALNTIQVFTPTDFMENVLQAVTLYNNGKYDESLIPWQKVLEMDSTYKLGQVGVAKSLLRSGKSSESLNLYIKALDKEGYSEAFSQIRTDLFRQNFAWVVLIIIVAIVAVFLAVKYLKKYADRIADRPVPKNDKFGLKFFIETVVCVLFHPMDTFYKIKYNRKSLRVWPLILMFIILVVEKIAFRSIIHFPLTDSAIFVDYFRDLVVFFLPLVSWIIVAYAISSISDGKQTFLETATTTMYSFVPMMLLYLPITALSRLMATSESGLYNGLQLILLLWCLILIYLNFKILNEYSFGKAVWNIIKVLFAILCLWVICFLFLIVISQLLIFIKDIYSEFIYLTKRGG